MKHMFYRLHIGLLLLTFAGLALFGMPSRLAAEDQIKWQPFGEGMNMSKSMDRPMLLHFFSNNCRFCDLMVKETFSDAEVIDLIRRRFIPVKVNIDSDQKLPDSFRVRGVPDTWFINSDGKIYGHRPGFINKEMFLRILDMVLKQSEARGST